MTYRGTVQRGVIVLPEGVALAEGTEVLIEPLPPPRTEAPASDAGAVWRNLMELAGAARGLPADLAERHDHYRRQRLGL
jgi:hypothetical protein